MCKSFLRSPTEYMTSKNITIRLLLNNKEAGIIIGSKGSTIEKIRADFDVRIAISEHIEGCYDRICSLNGPAEDLSKSCAFIAEKIRKNQMLLRILLSHFLIGTIIGKKGSNVKELRENGIKVTCFDDLLPQSTDRMVLIIGDDIHYALTKILDWIKDSPVNNIYYDPSKLVDHKGVLYRTSPRGEKSEDKRKNKNVDEISENRAVTKTTLSDKDKISKSKNASSRRKITIPKSMQSKVLGDRDSNLKQIGYDSGVKFEKEYLKDESLVVTMFGLDEELNAAFQMIKKISDEE
eukprot:NODE_3_length_80033_cov_0.932970.p27 type:complete len:293 gc:universal NODE_3_length_80033_cov_0.932970:77546-76668(-)